MWSSGVLFLKLGIPRRCRKMVSPIFGDTKMPPDWLGDAFYVKVGIPRGYRQIGSETRFMRVVPKGEMPRNGCYGTP